MNRRHLFCFGLGYTGKALGDALLQSGWRVSGTCRTPGKKETLIKAGYETFLFENAEFDPGLVGALADADCVLSTIPPSADGDPVLSRFHDALVSGNSRSWVGYLSTTGVYGNRDGAIVDEDSPTQPDSERGQRRVEAEARWMELLTEYHLPVHLFRLAAIYGPGRNALARALSGKAKRIDKPGLVFSRIHIEDVVQVLRASVDRGHPGRAYNLADDEPAAPEEVVRFACDLLKMEPPPLQALSEAGLSPLGFSFYQDNKRVANERIKSELRVSLRFPDYRVGLTHLLATLDPPQA